MPVLDAHGWEDFLAGFPNAHILQTAAWGELKAAFGWQPIRLRSQSGSCGVQILFRRLPLGFSIAYIPKGPTGTDWETLWPEVERISRQQRAIFLKIEPDAWEGTLPPGFEMPAYSRPSRPIQPRRTIEIDLSGSPQDWLARMRQKTRYNIRLAERKEVQVRQSDDIALFHRLSLQTAARDGFGVHSQAYFQRAFDLFYAREACALLVAAYANQPLAALMVFSHGRRAWYFYGASTDLERNRMPAYLLQWEAMRWAASKGCQVYDLWGIPDEDENVLEENFTLRADGLWGVYRFKRGFGGVVRRSAGAWDRVYIPWLYRFYSLYSRWRGGEEN